MEGCSAEPSCNNKCNENDDGSSSVRGVDLLFEAREGRGGDKISAILEKDPTQIHVTDVVGDTIFHVMARAGDLEAAKQLVGFVKEHGSEEVLMEQNLQGDTPLHLAVANHHEEVARLFYEAERRAGWLLNKDGVPPLRLAMDFGFTWFNAISAFEVQEVSEAGIEMKETLSYGVGADIEMGIVRRALRGILNDSQNPHPAASGLKEFILAIRKGQQDLVLYVLRKQPDMASRKLGLAGSFLHLAAQCGQVEMLKILVRQMTPDKAAGLMCMGDCQGNTPLHLAVEQDYKDLQKKHRDTAHYLIEFEPRAAYQVNQEGVSPLHLAVEEDYEDLIRLIFKVMSSKGVPAPIEASLVTAAISNGNLGILRLLVGQMTPDAAASLMLEANAEGNTPLHVSLKKNHKDVASYLIELAPETAYKLNKRGVSPLHLAVQKGHHDIVKYIFQIIPVSNICSFTRESLHCDKKALLGHAAIKVMNLGILESLMEELPELIDIQDYKGWRVLSYAAYKGYLDGVHYLLTKFPNSVKKYDRDGSLPIHKAVGGGHVSIVKQFLQHSPETLNDVDKNGQSILHFAVKYTKVDVLSFLTKENKEQVEKIFRLKDNEGKTFIDLANELKR